MILTDQGTYFTIKELKDKYNVGISFLRTYLCRSEFSKFRGKKINNAFVYRVNKEFDDLLTLAIAYRDSRGRSRELQEKFCEKFGG